MPSFGEELRRERELRRITLREVAESTKVNLRYLQALESNDFEHLPGGVFNRGFVRAYSQYIGIDPDAMVDAYLLEEQAQATRGRAQDRDVFLRPRDGLERGADERAPARAGARLRATLKWALLAIAASVVLVGALLLYLHWNRADAPERDAAPATPRASDGAGGER